jgi:hypothetical protein
LDREFTPTLSEAFCALPEIVAAFIVRVPAVPFWNEFLSLLLPVWRKLDPAVVSN